MSRIFRLSWVAAISAAAVGASGVRAEAVYGVTTTNSLVTFDTASVNSVTTIGGITGLTAGHELRGVDFRPSDGKLYALSTSTSDLTQAQLYTINLTTSVATLVGGLITLTGNTSARVSIDFNPVANALRVVTGSDQSYRINANFGTLTAQDTNISPSRALIRGLAYSNNFVGATQTTLYGYDFDGDNLGTIGGINGSPSPNLGAFSSIGASGFSIAGSMGFDISGVTGDAYFSGDDGPGSVGIDAEFFRMNLATGALTQISNDDFLNLLDFSLAVRPLLAVPEPGTVALALGALGVLMAGARRRRPAAGAPA